MRSTLRKSNVKFLLEAVFPDITIPLADFHSPQMTSRCVVYEVSIKLPLYNIHRDTGSMDRPIEPKVVQPHDALEAGNPIQIPA